MNLYPVALAVVEDDRSITLFSFCVQAVDYDQAFGKAHRVARGMFPGGEFHIKVNTNSNPMEPNQAVIVTRRNQ